MSYKFIVGESHLSWVRDTYQCAIQCTFTIITRLFANHMVNKMSPAVSIYLQALITLINVRYGIVHGTIVICTVPLILPDHVETPFTLQAGNRQRPQARWCPMPQGVADLA